MNFTLYSQQRGLRSPTTLGKVLVSCTVRLTFGIYPTPVRAFPDLPIVLQMAVKDGGLNYCENVVQYRVMEGGVDGGN